jgi:hypothetical protein
MTPKATLENAEFPALVVAAFIARNAAILIALSIWALAALLAP